MVLGHNVLKYSILALYTLTQVPDGEIGAMRLCLISVVVAMVALVASELVSSRIQARMRG